VPVDFDWPLNEVWSGFLMPDSLRMADCPDCDATGYSPGARVFADTFYPHMIPTFDRAAQERLAWHDKIGQAEVDNLIAAGRGRLLSGITAGAVNAAQRRRHHQHDAINRGILVRFRCERLGIEPLCSTCQGQGAVEAYPGQRAEEEAWERTEPPAGDGWQLWETVSEGSPISPVFPERDGLIEWLCSDAYRFGISRPLTRDAAEAFVSAGWAPTMIVRSDGQPVSGDEGFGAAR
jgi:hypothetical protein